MKNLDVLFTLTVCLCWSIVKGQQGVLVDTLRYQAEQHVLATVNSNYDTILEYLHPNAIDYMGNEEKVIESIRKLHDDLAVNGWYLKSIEIQDSIIVEKQDVGYHALVPKILTISNGRKEIFQKGYLLGFSGDKGRKWYFVDTSQYRTQIFRDMFPDFKTTIKIPEKIMPSVRELEQGNEERQFINNKETLELEMKDFIIGEWEGSNPNNLNYIRFDENGYIIFTLNGQEIGGKEFEKDGEMANTEYEINSKTNPMEIDIIITDLNTHEVARLLGIIEVIDENNIYFSLGSEGLRPKEFLERNSSHLMRKQKR
ncbi:hypothetical protein [Spongiimicrobium sp. 2-473A-2-J]|uniref:hypothetical protein n=1 Tax=Eudoraea algarum TaxID=3417568 RepID=UPI003D36BD97